jgi:histidinol-phosphate aminotransferase
MSIISRLLRPDIAALEPYAPILPLEVLAEQLGIPAERLVKLDANENPYGPSPRAREAIAALAAAEPSPYAIYPDPDHTRLRAALSEFSGQPPERIICGAGADELIDLLMRALLLPGDAIVDCPPTFGMYSFDAGLFAARVMSVPRGAEFELDLEGVAEAAEWRSHPRSVRGGAKMLFVASPNNPSGNRLPRHELMRLLELPLLVVVDEAYAEFSGEHIADMVGGPPNLVVLRTFSKWAGLAGLRVGYALCHEELAGHLRKIKQPYNVNVAAEAAALASLADLDERMEKVGRIVAERERLSRELAALPGLMVYPSAANFVLCRLAAGAERALAVRDALRRQGILVRYFSKPGLQDCIRISVGTPEQNNAVLAALGSLLV